MIQQHLDQLSEEDKKKFVLELYQKVFGVPPTEPVPVSTVPDIQPTPVITEVPMPSIPQLGPGYKGYKIEFLSNTAISLDATTSYNLFEKKDAEGFIIAFAFESNKSTITMKTEIDGTSVDHTLANMDNDGWNSPTNQLPFLSKYDTTNNIYAMQWIPQTPIPFSNYFKFLLRNTGTATATLNRANLMILLPKR